MPVVTEQELVPFRADQAKQFQDESGFTDTMKALGSVGNGLVSDSAAPAPAPTAAGDTGVPPTPGMESSSAPTPAAPPQGPQPAPAAAPQQPNETPPPAQSSYQSALDWGNQQVGKPYIWGSAGGRSDLTGSAPGYDCSGFVSQFYHQMGQSVPAQTRSAYAATTPVAEKDAQPGDIVEWMDPSGDPTKEHMAVYIGNGKILQSGGTQHKVNVGNLNQFGNTYEFRRAAGAPTVAGDTTATTKVASTAAAAAPPKDQLASTLDSLGSLKDNVAGMINGPVNGAGDALHDTLGKLQQVGQQGLDFVGQGIQEQAQGQKSLAGAIGNVLTEPQPALVNAVGAQTKQMQGQELTPQEQYVQARSIASGLAGSVNPEAEAFGGLRPTLGGVADAVRGILHPQPEAEPAVAPLAQGYFDSMGRRVPAPGAVNPQTAQDLAGPQFDQMGRRVGPDGAANAQTTADLASTPAAQPATDLYNTGGTSPPVSGGIVDETGHALPNANPQAQTLAQDYAHQQGLDELPTTKYVKNDIPTQQQIADFYEKAQSTPDDPAVKASYDAFRQEVQQQYQFLEQNGVKFEPYHDPQVPYANSQAMMDDVRNNHHMWVYADSLDNPMLSPEENWMFRAVHDYFGHAANGLSFGPRGEENAWISHAKMFSPDARPAMTTETRGQNSWVNFGPYGEQNRANPAATTFAEQKAVLLPEEFHQRPDAYFADSTEPRTANPATEPQPNLAFEGPSPSAQRPPLPNGEAVNSALQQRLGVNDTTPPAGGGRPGTSPLEPEVAATLPQQPAPQGDLRGQLADSLVKVMRDHGYSQDAINERLSAGGYTAARGDDGTLQAVQQVGGGAIEAPANPEAGVHATLQNGGATLDPQTLEPVHLQSGFAVSRPGGVVVDQADFTPEVLQNFAKDVDKGAYVGTWLDNGKVYLDATDIVPDKQQAMELGAKNQQQAIYDHSTGEVIDVPPSEQPAQPEQPGVLDRVRDLLGNKQDAKLKLSATTTKQDVDDLAQQFGPDVPAQELAKLPGMQNTTSSLGDIRTAVQVGKPFAGWYKDIANWFLKEVGPDNLHEALSIFAHTSPGASVADNAAAVTSLMRAVRQVKQEGLWDLARTRGLFEKAKNITEFANDAIGTADHPGLDPAMQRIWSIVNGEDRSRNVMKTNVGKMMQGYLTGKVVQSTNAKTYSYFENLLNSVSDMFGMDKTGPDMRTTIDQFMGRLFSPTNAGGDQIYSTGALHKDVGDPAWYRSAEAILQHVAGTEKMSPNEAQAAAWFAIRSIVGKAVPRPPEILAIARKLESGQMSVTDAIQAADKTGFYDDMLKAGQDFSKETGQPAPLREVYRSPQYQKATANAAAAGIDIKSPPPDDVQRNIRVVYPDTWHRQVGGLNVPARTEPGEVFPNRLNPTGGAQEGKAMIDYATTLGGVGAGGVHALATTDPNDPDRWKKVALEASVGGLAGYTGGRAIEGLTARKSTAALPYHVNSLLNSAGNVADDVRTSLNHYDGAIASGTTKADRDLANGVINQQQHDDAVNYIKSQAQQFFLDDITASSGAMPKIQQGPTGSHVQVSPPDGWIPGSKLPGGAAIPLNNYWVSPETAQLVTTTLTRNQAPTGAAAAVSGAARVASLPKQIILNTPFHWLQEELKSVTEAFGSGHPGQALGQVAQSTWNTVNPVAFKKWWNDAQTGKWVDRAASAGVTFRGGEATDLLRGLKGAAINAGVGGTLSGVSTYGTEKAAGTPEDQARTDALRNGLLGGALAGAGVPIGHAIFDRQIPTLKLNTFKMLVQGGTPEEAAAQIVNSNYGGQNLVRMGRSQVMQDALRLTTFAPDWWEGIAKSVGNAIPGMAGSGAIGANARRQLATDTVAAALTLEGLNVLFTGHTTDKNADGFKAQLEVPHSLVAGRVPGAPPGVQGQLDHIDILAWRRPLMELAGMSVKEGQPLEAAKQFVAGRASTVAAAVPAIATNQDWRGKPIVQPGAGPVEQIGAGLDYAANQIQPGGVQSLQSANKTAGLAGAAVSYGTGFRESSETPGQQSSRSYYNQQPQTAAQIQTWMEQQPEYKAATPAERSALLRQATTEADRTLRSQVGMPPADYGMPQRYVGVSDRTQEQAITDAHAKVAAYDSDPRHAVRPTAQERSLASKAVETPQYKKAATARTQQGHDLSSRLQDQLAGMRSKP